MLRVNRRIMLVGNYPPPSGGIAVHIQRLYALLERAHAVEVLDVYNGRASPGDPIGVSRLGLRSVRNVLRVVAKLRFTDANVVHLHTSHLRSFEWFAGPLWACLPPHPRKILTIHGGKFPEAFRAMSSFRRNRVVRHLARFDRVIVVNETARQVAAQSGLPESKLALIPAFLPPIARTAPDVQRAVDRLKEFGRRTLVVSGSARPYYGFHNVLDAIDESGLRDRIGVIFAFYGRPDAAYEGALRARLGAGWNHAVFSDLDAEAFTGLLSSADIFVRPTDRDGDSIAVREAAALGKQVVASDCAPRPPGVVLYKTMDSHALGEALTTVLENQTVGLAHFDISQYQNELMALYAELLGNSH